MTSISMTGIIREKDIGYMDSVILISVIAIPSDISASMTRKGT